MGPFVSYEGFSSESSFEKSPKASQNNDKGFPNNVSYLNEIQHMFHLLGKIKSLETMLYSPRNEISVLLKG